jgi:intracellular septation protein
MNSNLRFVLDFSPLVIFFAVYKLAGLLPATATLIACSLLALLITYAMEKRIAVMPLVSGIVITVMGTLTLVLQDETFIKVKPTVVNLVFAAILLGGLYFGKSLFKYVLGHAIQLKDEGWRQLTWRWGMFFTFLALLNEVVWRNFSTDFWVNFKVFGMFSLTMLFTLGQLPLIKRFWIEEQAPNSPDASV